MFVVGQRLAVGQCLSGQRFELDVCQLIVQTEYRFPENARGCVGGESGSADRDECRACDDSVKDGKTS